VDVSYSGGVFEGAILLKHFSTSLQTRGEYRLREPAFSPVIGAALYAAKQCGKPLPEEALARLRTEALK
jgi:hypothetical protein